MICFFCYTPYHIFNVLNIKCNMYKNTDADLYLYSPESGGTLPFYENIVESGIFKNVYILENLWYKRNRITKRLKLYGSYKNFFSLKKAGRIYDEIWSYGSAIEMYMILGISLRKNPNTKYYCYEEGEGSYVHPCTNALHGEQISFLKKLKIKIPEIPEKILLYRPELALSGVNTVKGTMPEISENTKKKICAIFDISKNSMEFSCLLFGTGFKDQTPIFEIIDILKNNNIGIMIKPHPRVMTPYIDNNINLLECGSIPWEVICGTTDDIENKLLICFYSSTLFTPKLIFNKEPYIIFLDQLDGGIHSKWINDIHKQLLCRFVQLYENKEKIMRPKNTEEFIECIKKWKSSRGND